MQADNALLAQHESSSFWLRSASFDLIFIIGIFILTVVLGGIASLSNRCFLFIFFLNFWLIAPAHLMSTVTRAVYHHRFLVTSLPMFVFIIVVSISWFSGAVALNSIYFCWMTWHYTRQSHGITRAYRRTALPGVSGRDYLIESIIYGFAIFGLLSRIASQPQQFLGVPLWQFALPKMIVYAAGACCMSLFMIWMIQQEKGKATPGDAHALFVMSHVAMTLIGFVIISDITLGWLFINLWHNTQYLFFVWHANNKKFENCATSHFVSWLSQRRNIFYYMLVCTGIGILPYCLITQTNNIILWQGLPLAVILYQTLAFHHYIMDSLIWRASKSSKF